MPKKRFRRQKKGVNWNRIMTLLCFGFVLITSYFTYFHNYQHPNAFYWDENYYVTDAQRIMNRVFFMQIHPPLGKMLIALGEVIVDANDDDAQFLDTEHAKDAPKAFSLAGYRLFPVMLAWAIAPILFFIFILITKNPLAASLFSFLYIFDNALIVHSRGAMLDAPLHFFIVLGMLLFLLLFYSNGKGKKFLLLSAFFGITLGMAATTKLNGLILVIPAIFLLWKFRKMRGGLFGFLAVSGTAFLITFVSIWHIHLNRMEIIGPNLRNEGFYLASEEYKQILKDGKQSSLFSFPVMLRDHLRYVPHYNKGIPKLDLCKPDENGSPFFLWPIGATAINYRWSSAGNNAHSYLYLVANPAVWLAGLTGVILSVVFLLGPLFFKRRQTVECKDRKFIMIVLFTMYATYLAIFSMMDRVNFLYAYFPALIISFFLLALAFREMSVIAKYKLNEDRKTMLLIILAFVIFLSFQFMRPLTYYEPLDKAQVENRSLIRLWNLHCVGCKKPSPIIRHQCD